jgi:hypothetical protein
MPHPLLRIPREHVVVRRRVLKVFGATNIRGHNMRGRDAPTSWLQALACAVLNYQDQKQSELPAFTLTRVLLQAQQHTIIDRVLHDFLKM